MAALLRHAAATRIGDSMIWRAETEGRRRLWSRLIQTDRPETEGHLVNPNYFQAAARRIGGSLFQRAHAEERRRLVYTAEEQAHAELTRKIQQKKEELYNVICKAEQSFWTSSFRNRRLLERLAVQVNPRPGDFKWHRLCFVRRAIKAMYTAGAIALAGVVTSVALHLKSFTEDTRRKMREAREDLA